MSELANALHTIGKIDRPFVIQFPTGKWGFVGRVPMELYYTMRDGAPLSDELANGITQFGAGLYGRTIRRVVFDTESAALAALAEYERTNV